MYLTIICQIMPEVISICGIFESPGFLVRVNSLTEAIFLSQVQVGILFPQVIAMFPGIKAVLINSASYQTAEGNYLLYKSRRSERYESVIPSNVLISFPNMCTRVTVWIWSMSWKLCCSSCGVLLV